ncbi:MAG: hypothetical protein HY327_12700 [Chloroflexi bacterium]|nr:hypothetical protein [Chloroflexota bacterium]
MNRRRIAIITSILALIVIALGILAWSQWTVTGLGAREMNQPVITPPTTAREKYMTTQGITMLRGTLAKLEGTVSVKVHVVTQNEGEFDFTVDLASTPVFISIAGSANPVAVDKPLFGLETGLREKVPVRIAYHDGAQVLSILIEFSESTAALFPTSTANGTPTAQAQFALKPDWTPTAPGVPTINQTTRNAQQATLTALATPTSVGRLVTDSGKITSLDATDKTRLRVSLQSRNSQKELALIADLTRIKVYMASGATETLVKDPVSALQNAKEFGQSVLVSYYDSQPLQVASIKIVP